jgi:hypothetical protein
MDALDLLHRYADRAGRDRFYDRAERIPIEGVVPRDWREAIIDERGRVLRSSYELCVLGALRDAIRRREIWVEGASRWRNPEADLPRDFDLHRDVHYAAIRQPTDPTAFVQGQQRRLDAALGRLAEAIRTDTAGGVRIGSRRGQVWESNLMTEWHQRYQGPGVMVYWHIERKASVSTASSNPAPPARSRR